jgi:DNA-binding CsgD family transcriptional regulator
MEKNSLNFLNQSASFEALNDHVISSKPLSSKQTEIMKLLCEGRTTKEISKQIGGSPNTIETHIKAIFYKLNAKNRSHAVFLFSKNLDRFFG